MQQITRGLWFEDSYLGVTIGAVVHSFGAVYIDAPLRLDDARAWKNALLNQRGGSNRLLISLDAHPDRTLGSRLMDCMVVAQQKTSQSYRNRPTIFKGQNTLTGAAWETYSESIGMRWLPPDITFTRQMSLHWGGSEIIMEHRPGPAAGACWVIIPADKVVFVGDCVAVNQPSFFAHANLDDWLLNLETLKKDYSDFQVIGGRGGSASRQAINEQLQHVKNLVRGIEKIIKIGGGPDATEDLVPGLLSGFSFDPELKDMYAQRLKYGLYQYYARNYRPASSLEQASEEDGES